MDDHEVRIFHSEEDGGYIAEIPALEFCSAFGVTPQQALIELETAEAAWLQAAGRSGDSREEPEATREARP